MQCLMYIAPGIFVENFLMAILGSFETFSSKPVQAVTLSSRRLLHVAPLGVKALQGLHGLPPLLRGICVGSSSGFRRSCSLIGFERLLQRASQEVGMRSSFIAKGSGVAFSPFLSAGFFKHPPHDSSNHALAAGIQEERNRFSHSSDFLLRALDTLVSNSHCSLDSTPSLGQFKSERPVSNHLADARTTEVGRLSLVCLANDVSHGQNS